MIKAESESTRAKVILYETLTKSDKKKDLKL